MSNRTDRESPRSDREPPTEGPRPPHPPPVPIPTRLGNPSITPVVLLLYVTPGKPPNGPVEEQSPEPLPPRPNREETQITLTRDKDQYDWGEVANLTATLTFVKDGAPLTGRPVVFVLGGTTYVPVTDSQGIAKLTWAPWDVPGPGEPPAYTFSAFATFEGD